MFTMRIYYSWREVHPGFCTLDAYAFVERHAQGCASIIEAGLHNNRKRGICPPFQIGQIRDDVECCILARRQGTDAIPG
jgi:hypothetical protein